MMIVQGEKMSVPSSLELVQHLYDKNVELEKRCRRSAQARVPSDPNTWQQMRENYETIILKNHVFSEQHNIEYALWQLHYRRIEDFRAHLSAASASMGSATSHTGKGGLTQTNRVTKIRLQFKAFLSEATGFYHDLILKIRAKTGLPIGHFPEDSDNLIDMEKDGKRSGELKKGLISCNRCLIYLGDLARYKGLYGEGESKSGDYAAASSYYLQAASLWPSSGNPHHQLAILATYSGDELLTVYHYFRSLAVGNPFSTAKDNLIVVFEKNRKSYSQLHGGTKGLAIKESPEPTNNRGRRKAGATVDYNSATEKAKKIHEAYKAFSICFVQLNGILFTRTSLETFGGVLSLVSSALHELLSSGPEEELNFGTDAVDNGLLILRLTSILIFTVHNVKREAEGQSYADLLQLRVLLQNALTAAFDLMGHIVKRCLQLSDPSTSYLLPGILVFVEWLASCPDLSVGNDIDDKQAHIISNFWNDCITFLNKLLCGGLVSIEDEDEVCFSNMGKYKEGETESQLALKEDLELRGFLPLQPAQSILDFSRRHSFAGDKEKKARAGRILAAGKALANAVKVDKKPLRFDPKLKKFVIGNAPQKSDDTIPTPQSGSPKTSGGIRGNLADSTTKAIVQQQKAQPCFESEEEEEEIIFKPTVFERRTDDSLVSDPRSNIIRQPSSVTNLVPQYLQLYQSNPSMWLVDSQASLGNGFKNLILSENGHVMKPLMQEDIRISQTASLSLTTEQPVNATGISYGQSKSSGATIQPKIDRSSAFTNVVSLGVNPVTCSSKGPPNRPVRRLGPPPGFSSARPKQVTEGNFGSSDLKGENPLINNNSWLNAPLHSNPQYIGNFPGKQALQFLNLNPEQVAQQQYITLPKQHQGQSLWTGHHPV